MIYRLLLAAGFSDQFSQWMTAQSAHETDNFSSRIYKQNFNAFGIKYFGQATARGEKNGYAYYLDHPESIADYKRLFKSYGLVTVATSDKFCLFLKQMGYFEAPLDQYQAGVKSYLNLYFPGGELVQTLKTYSSSW